jgi:hypothetical protein
VIIEFLPPVVVLNVAPAFRLKGMVFEAVCDHHRAFPFPVWILQKRFKALPVQTCSLGQSAKVNERGVDIDQADRTLAQLVFHHTFGC